MMKNKIRVKTKNTKKYTKKIDKKTIERAEVRKIK